jgi:hypothetical protein
MLRLRLVLAVALAVASLTVVQVAQAQGSPTSVDATVADSTNVNSPSYATEDLSASDAFTAQPDTAADPVESGEADDPQDLTGETFPDVTLLTPPDDPETPIDAPTASTKRNAALDPNPIQSKSDLVAADRATTCSYSTAEGSYTFCPRLTTTGEGVAMGITDPSALAELAPDGDSRATPALSIMKLAPPRSPVNTTQPVIDTATTGSRDRMLTIQSGASGTVGSTGSTSNGAVASKDSVTTTSTGTTGVTPQSSRRPPYSGLPSWCTTSTYRWVRFAACRAIPKSVDAYRVVSGRPQYVGTGYFYENSYQYSDASYPDWVFQLSINMYYRTGSFPTNTRVQGYDYQCGGYCSVVSDFPSQAVFGDLPYGIGWTDTGSYLRSGTVLYTYSTWRYYFTAAGYTSSGAISSGSSTFRCDQWLKGYSSSRGCVVPWYDPTLYYKHGNYPEFAGHLKAAIGSGLPNYLTRMYSASGIRDNRNKSCPKSLHRPKGKSCDEYPFASTYQGAATQGGNPKPRTFKGCAVPGKTRTGPSGYSRCMINTSQNSKGGTDLGGFYRWQRLLDHDDFYVRII